MDAIITPGVDEMTPYSEICQSCGMPLVNDDQRGTESDGSRSGLYCSYCYGSGSFSEPDLTMKEMEDRCAGMMNQMFEIPMEHAHPFVHQQLASLLRWSGKLFPICGSCGMSITSPEDTGMESDGARNDRYCIHCYQNGALSMPDATLEEMAATYAPVLVKEFGISHENAMKMVTGFSAALPRWKNR